MACGGCGGGKRRPVKSLKKDDGMEFGRVSKIKQGVYQPSESQLNNATEDTEEDIRKSEALANLRDAARSQKSPLKWFKDGVTGLAKCVMGDTLYDDDTIQAHRNICADCEFATSKSVNGKLTIKSQCMAPDPETGEKCGCFLLCKTQSDECSLKKWPVNLTIDGN